MEVHETGKKPRIIAVQRIHQGDISASVLIKNAIDVLTEHNVRPTLEAYQYLVGQLYEELPHGHELRTHLRYQAHRFRKGKNALPPVMCPLLERAGFSQVAPGYWSCNLKSHSQYDETTQ